MRFFQKLDQLETRLQVLIEGSVARLFPEYDLEHDLAHQLVAALRRGTKQHPDGYLIAPNLFTLQVHPSRAGLLSQQEAFFDELTRSLEEAADETGLCFLSPPVIRIVEDAEMPLYQFQVNAQISQEKLTHTTDILIEPESGVHYIPQSAFLIVNGTQTIPLESSVINIGRRPDNHLVINDPRISRVHAQLRAINGRFVIFDLDSTGGTYVNQQRISQYTLFPGDVISLAGYPLVYGQEAAWPGETEKYDSPDGNEISPNGAG